MALPVGLPGIVRRMRLPMRAAALASMFVGRAVDRGKLSAARRTQAVTLNARQTVDMLRLGYRIRLTGREVERFTRITGIEPLGVKSLDDLDHCIGQCKDHCAGPLKGARLLRWLLDEERSRCLCAA